MNANSIKDRLRLSIPKGAQIHFLDITYNPGCEWVEALSGTDVNKQNYPEVLKIGSQFPPVKGSGSISGTIAMISYFSTSGMDRACTWAKSHGLQETTPREVFVIGKSYPKIYADLGQELTCVVATKKCKFLGYSGACYCWRTCDELRMGVGFLTDFDTEEHWYSFSIPTSML